LIGNCKKSRKSGTVVLFRQRRDGKLEVRSCGAGQALEGVIVAIWNDRHEIPGESPMRTYLSSAVLGFFGVLLATMALAQEYRLNPGDVLRVSVWREEGLERELLVQPDGTISFPLAGQVEAVGRTAGELEADLAAQLERFIPGPVVTVELIEARGNLVYVMGEVNSPGAFQLGRPTTVMQVLSQAGGFTPFAGRGRIKIIRTANGEKTTIPFNYKDVARGRDGSENIVLKAGDVVVVPGGALF
jgi:polysaccharide biosynthesis/export protein